MARPVAAALHPSILPAPSFSVSAPTLTGQSPLQTPPRPGDGRLAQREEGKGWALESDLLDLTLSSGLRGLRQVRYHDEPQFSYL